VINIPTALIKNIDGNKLKDFLKLQNTKNIEDNLWGTVKFELVIKLLSLS
jgi:hypothetical protein